MVRLLFICLILTFVHLSMQSWSRHTNHFKTKKEQLQQLAEQCDSLNKVEQYNKTQQIARYALAMADSGDHYNRSRFYFYMGLSYRGVITDSTVFYYEKSLHYARLAKNDKRIRNALRELLYIYINVDGYTSKRDSAAAELNHTLDTTTVAGIKIDCYSSLADYYAAIGWNEQELNYRLQGLELAVADMKQGKYKDTDADSTNIGVAYFNVGDLYEKLNQYDKAQEYYRKARPLLWNYMAGICSYYKGMATTSLKQGKARVAEQYADSLRRMVDDKMNGNAGLEILLDLYLTNTDYYLGMQNATAAMPYLKRAGTLVDSRITETLQISSFQYAMGRALLVQKNYTAALPYLQKAEKANSSFSMAVYARLMRALAECYEGLGQWQNAAVYYKRYLPLRDSVDAKSAQQSMANAEARFQNRQKLEEIEAQKVQISFAHQQRLWLIGGIVALLLLAVLLFLFYRNKKRNADHLSKLNAALEEANRTKARLFGIISHDLRSPINQVYQFLQLQQLNPDALNAAQKTELNNKIKNATGSLLETMEDLLLWSKTQMSEFKINLQPVNIAETVQQVLALLQLNITAKSLVVDDQIPNPLVIDTDPYFLQTIVRNLLQNAVKASRDSGKLLLQADAEGISIANEGALFTQEQYEAALRDNDADKGLSGLGLKLIDELSRKINTTILFHTETSGFTTAVLSFGGKPVVHPQ